jgi:CRISPR-associated protein Csd1
MILQALKEYYDRKAEDQNALAPPGFEWKKIPFVILLKEDGTPVRVENTVEGVGRSKSAKTFLVPQGVKKSCNIAANLLWGNAEYVLGIPDKNLAERVEKQHAAFIQELEAFPDRSDEGIQAVLRFLKRADKIKLLEAVCDGRPQDLFAKGANITFQLAGDSKIVAAREAVAGAIAEAACRTSGEAAGLCLVTGGYDTTEKLHPAIKGVYGAKSSGANIVSFNLDAFTSFGKAQGANAPVGRRAAFKYTTALNHLLGKDSRQKLLVGDTTVVCWAERDHEIESQLADFFGEPQPDDPDRGARAVASLYASIENGTFLDAENSRNRFYALGLSPNASRIAVRFWIVDTVAGIGQKIKRHFEDLKIVHRPGEIAVFSLRRLLASTAVQGKADNIPPNLAGDTVRAVLEGTPYPKTLLQAAIRRIRAEREITYVRAALIKAAINRSTRFKTHALEEELKMSLDENNTSIGYRLGRLFAVLEKIQQEANPGINATIRDRFYGAASGTPAAVFGNLMRLKNHHLAKLSSQGRKIFFEKLLGEILSGVPAAVGFPAHLGLEEQGRFAIGYYHQQRDFFARKE